MTQLQEGRKLTPATTWVKLKDIMLSEIIQSQKQILGDYLIYCTCSKFLETRSGVVVARGCGGERNDELLFNEWRAGDEQDEKSSGAWRHSDKNGFDPAELYT